MKAAPPYPRVSAQPTRPLLLRLMLSIRLDEVLALQGAAGIGLLMAMPSLGLTNLMTAAGLVAGNLFLVSHVFTLNDWSGLAGDLRDPHRSARTFGAQGVSRGQMLVWSLVLLGLGLAVFSILGVAPLAVGCAIAVLSALYSAPGLHFKGRPVLGTLLHLIGGGLHFLLGYCAYRPISLEATAIGAFFGLVFAAGHLMHESRDHGGDAINAIRTNAVVFGRDRAFVCGLVLFSLAYGLLTALAVTRVLYPGLALCILLYPIHLAASLRVLRAGLTFDRLKGLQGLYHRLFLVIGLGMAISAGFALATRPAPSTNMPIAADSPDR